jgi:hypothetical protein
MKKIKGGKVWTLPRRVQFRDLGFTSALPTLPSVTTLESYLDLLLARARYGKKLDAFTYHVYRDTQKIAAIEVDKSLPEATRKRLIRECQTSIGECLLLAAKYGKAQKVVDVMSRKWPHQSHQEKVFIAYRAVLRREGRPPTFREWGEQMLNGRSTPASNEQKRKLDHALREMAKVRFKLPITYAEGNLTLPNESA